MVPIRRFLQVKRRTLIFGVSSVVLHGALIAVFLTHNFGLSSPQPEIAVEFEVSPLEVENVVPEPEPDPVQEVVPTEAPQLPRVLLAGFAPAPSGRASGLEAILASDLSLLRADAVRSDAAVLVLASSDNADILCAEADVHLSGEAIGAFVSAGRDYVDEGKKKRGRGRVLTGMGPGGGCD